ncbi:MAG: lytic transglycosylase domain-containing protein [Bacteroidota bacterium]
MSDLSVLRPWRARRRRHRYHYEFRPDAFWRRAIRWTGRILFSPFVIVAAFFRGRAPVGSDWVRGFLVLGLLLLVASGSAILISQASDRAVFAALDSFSAADEHVPADKPYAAEINAAASHYDLNPLAVHFVITIESGGRPLCVSRRGAKGLMQLMPRTWRYLNPNSACRGDHGPRVCKAGNDCIFSTWGNIRIGTLYLDRLLEIYDGDYVAALQAYNAGQRHVIFAPRAKFAETRRYVDSFLRFYERVQRRQLAMRLTAASRWRRLVRPLLLVLAGHLILATCFFWRRHRHVS